MKVGLCLPYSQEGLSWEILREWCRRIDEGPFSALSCGERMVGPGVDMMAMLGAAAAVTERVRIVPTLYVLPMHSASKVAKHAATLDLISDGRTMITVGVGGRPQDYAVMEREPVRQQHKKMSEQVAQIRRIWAGEPPLEGAEPLGPRPVQPGGPPILAGVTRPRAIAQAVHWADGIYSWSGNGDRSEMKAQQEVILSEWDRAARDEPPIRIAGFWYSLAPDADAKLKNYVYKYIRLAGEGPAKAMARTVDRSSREAIHASLDAYEELGIQECWLNSATPEIAEIDGLLEILDERG